MKYVDVLLAVSDIRRSRAFYEELFGLRVAEDYGQNIRFENGFYLQENFGALTGIPPREIQAGRDAELYFTEEDMDGFAAKVQAMGVEMVHPLLTHPWGQRVLRIYDPDRHIIEIGEPLPYVAARFLREGKTVEETAAVTQLPRAAVERLSAKRENLLIVVDYQVDFVGGALGFEGAEKLEGRIADKIAAARKAGADVAFTLDTHDDRYLDTAEGRALPVRHCIKGTAGHALYGKIARLRESADRVFEKASFGSGALYEYLKTSAYRRIELVGLVSNICVLTNAVLAAAALPEAEIVVDKACTAAFDDSLHTAALAVLKGLYVKIV